MNSVTVTSHIGRDLIQSANMFKTADIAVWEYIVNSVQYISPGKKPVVTIDINNKYKRIIIEDNGRGMDLEGLNNFFKMHGENIDRRSGNQGRGKFGTGKSAAFGIGKKLTVTSMCNGKKNTVTLHKKDILNSNGSEIPVTITETNVDVDAELSGTIITIEEIILPKIDSQKIIKKIEKHLQSYRQLSPEILVGDHICTYKEPNFQDSFTFNPDAKLEPIIGKVELTIKVSQSPLVIDERGILISSGVGNLVALEDAGVCSKDMGEYLYGEIDVPNLDSNKYEIEAYNSSRDMKLRPEHPVAMALNIFIGTSLETIRKKLVSQKREDLKTEASKQLKEQADKIAELLNNDFKELNDKILEIRSSTSSFGKSSAKASSDEDHSAEDGWVSGIEERGVLEGSIIPELDPSKPDNDDIKDKNSNEPTAGHKDDLGNAAVDPLSSGENKKTKRPRGGFQVQYENLGKDEDRAIYTADKGVFIVNLDHPLVKSAFDSLGINDIGFQRLSHEIIFSEYALALANMAAVDDPDIPADDVIYDARETLNRISVKSALLYQI